MRSFLFYLELDIFRDLQSLIRYFTHFVESEDWRWRYSSDMVYSRSPAYSCILARVVPLSRWASLVEWFLSVNWCSWAPSKKKSLDNFFKIVSQPEKTYLRGESSSHLGLFSVPYARCTLSPPPTSLWLTRCYPMFDIWYSSGRGGVKFYLEILWPFF